MNHPASRPAPTRATHGQITMHRHTAYPLADLKIAPPLARRLDSVEYSLIPRSRYAHLPCQPHLMAEVVVDLGGFLRICAAVLRTPYGPVLAVPHEAVNIDTGHRETITGTDALAAEIFQKACQKFGHGGGKS